MPPIVTEASSRGWRRGDRVREEDRDHGKRGSPAGYGSGTGQLGTYSHEDDTEQAEQGKRTGLLGSDRGVELASGHDHGQDHEGCEPPAAEQQAPEEQPEDDDRRPHPHGQIARGGLFGGLEVFFGVGAGTSDVLEPDQTVVDPGNRGRRPPAAPIPLRPPDSPPRPDPDTPGWSSRCTGWPDSHRDPEESSSPRSRPLPGARRPAHRRRLVPDPRPRPNRPPPHPPPRAEVEE